MGQNTNLEDIPKKPQRQDSLTDQLRDVVMAANQMGCYDAADFLQKFLTGEHVYSRNTK